MCYKRYVAFFFFLPHIFTLHILCLTNGSAFRFPLGTKDSRFTVFKLPFLHTTENILTTDIHELIILKKNFKLKQKFKKPTNKKSVVVIKKALRLQTDWHNALHVIGIPSHSYIQLSNRRKMIHGFLNFIQIKFWKCGSHLSLGLAAMSEPPFQSRIF